MNDDVRLPLSNSDLILIVYINGGQIKDAICVFAVKDLQLWGISAYDSYCDQHLSPTDKSDEIVTGFCNFFWWQSTSYMIIYLKNCDSILEMENIEILLGETIGNFYLKMFTDSILEIASFDK